MYKIINFPASKISTIIGKNPFNNSDDIFDEMKCKINGEIYTNTLNNNNTLTKNEIKQLSSILLPDIKISTKKKHLQTNLEQILVKSCENAVECNNTNDSHIIEKNIKKKISNLFPTKNNSEINNFINNNINTKRGTINENNIIQNYNKIHNTVVTDNNNKIYIFPLFEINMNGCLYKFNISAKIDGLHDGMLIEIKNRRYKLLNKIPPYEKIQLEIYLRILKLSQCKLIENYNQNIKEYDYKSNEKLWNNILTNLKSFSYKLLNDL